MLCLNISLKTRGELTTLTDEMLGNMKVVQAFGYQSEAQERFEKINNKLAGYSLKATFFSSITNPATRFVNSLVYAAVGITGAYAAIRGFMTVGQLTSFLSYANQYTKPFNEISGVVTELQNALASAARVFELIDEKTILQDKEDAEVLKDVKGQVEIEHVNFSYIPEKPLIEDLNLSVKPGERVAIVGPTGCGKTTVINLLMRFYEIQGGKICIDGIPTNQVKREMVHSQFCMVLQDTWLFEGTVRENLVYCTPNVSDERMKEACRAVGLDHFVRTLQHGYDTVLNDQVNLSQGQKQQLTIARAMIADKPMLILDEATSSVDTRTEVLIQKAMDNLMKGRTSFVIAHRLSTIRDADLILVMKDGDIVEQGNHEELLAKNGFYAEIYNSQFAAVG